MYLTLQDSIIAQETYANFAHAPIIAISQFRPVIGRRGNTRPHPMPISRDLPRPIVGIGSPNFPSTPPHPHQRLFVWILIGSHLMIQLVLIEIGAPLVSMAGFGPDRAIL